jgi:hypothetical protein
LDGEREGKVGGVPLGLTRSVSEEEPRLASAGNVGHKIKDAAAGFALGAEARCGAQCCNALRAVAT